MATVGDAKSFKNGRQMAAWLGLVPRQHSTGGKPTLLGISKRGDVYLTTLLIHGARAVVEQRAQARCGDAWLKTLAGTTQQEHRGGGARKQECAYRLGVADA